jgi:ribose transport system permease protein
MYAQLNKSLRSPDNLLLYLCVAYYLLMAIAAPGFFSVANSWNLLFNLLPLLLLSIGQTFVMLTAGIDLSVTSIVAMCSITGGFILSVDTGLGQTPGLAIAAGIGAMLLLGMAIGGVNGLAVARLGMPPFMVTLTTMIFFSGLAIWLTNSQNIYNLPDAFVDMPYANLLGIPIPALMAGTLVAVAWLILNKSIYGSWIYTLGLNPKVARISGVPVAGSLIFVYVFSGLSAALASVLYTARLETGSPVMGQQLLLDVIGAAVIGGTSLFGGKGKVQWTFFGVLFITLLDNSLNLIGLSYFLIMMAKGLVILPAAILYVWRDRSLKNA